MDLLQNAIVGLLLLSSALYLGRRAWLAVTARKVAGCGSGCSSCPSAKSGDGLSDDRKQLVGIGFEPDVRRD
jgi:hypothetical protein